jgi:hypothetical protein
MEEMLKGKCVVFANLKEKKLGGVPSHGMVMCAENADHTKLEIIRPPEDAVVGERVYLKSDPKEGWTFSQEPQAPLNPKKKLDDKFKANLKTDGDCTAAYNGMKLVTSKGEVTVPSLSNS